VAYALGAALAHLAPAPSSSEAGAEGQLGSPRQSRCYLGCRVEAAERCAQWRGGHGDERAAQQHSRRKPLDAVGHQVRDGKQPAELEGRDQVAGYALVRGRRPGAIQARSAGAFERIGAGQAA
jgi:hypothetical protein